MHTTVWNENIQTLTDLSDAAVSDSNQIEKYTEKKSVTTLVSYNFYLRGWFIIKSLFKMAVLPPFPPHTYLKYPMH